MIDQDDVDDDHDDDKVTVSMWNVQMYFVTKKNLTPFDFAEAKAMAEKAQADAMAMVQSKCVLQ